MDNDTEKSISADSEKTTESVTTAANQTELPSQGTRRGFIDRIGDLFETMVLGIFKFIFYKFPKFLINFILGVNWKEVVKRLFSIGRAIFWCTIWIFLIFAAWIAFAFEQFVRFWTMVGQHLLEWFWQAWDIICIYRGPIWLVLALIGSVYGLLYISLKKWAEKRNRVFHGVFGFLHRKKK